MPDRMCIVSRAVKDESELVRFARAPDGTVTPDLARKLPGRGVWVSLEKAKVAEAAKRGLFAKGFQAESKAAADLPDLVGQLLRREVVQSLSLARKAGEAVSGFMKVDDALVKGRTRLLFHASGSSADGQRKLDRRMGKTTVSCNFIDQGDLDLAFGRANVVHAAVADGGLAERLVSHVTRLARYEGLPMGQHEKLDDTGSEELS